MLDSFIPSQTIVRYAMFRVYLKMVLSLWSRMKGTSLLHATDDCVVSFHGLSEVEFLDREGPFPYVVDGPDVG